MPHPIKTTIRSSANDSTSRHMGIDGRAKRMESRLAELNVYHVSEVKRVQEAISSAHSVRGKVKRMRGSKYAG